MARQLIEHHDVSRYELWVGVLGGALAWLAHLLLAYLVAEFGCVGGLEHRMFAGITAVAWLLILVSLGPIGFAAYAVVVALRTYQRFPHEKADIQETRGTGTYMARAGVISSLLFILIILVQTVPIFFHLQEC